MHMIYRSWHPGTHSHPEEMADTGTWDEGWPVRGHYCSARSCWNRGEMAFSRCGVARGRFCPSKYCQRFSRKTKRGDMTPRVLWLTLREKDGKYVGWYWLVCYLHLYTQVITILCFFSFKRRSFVKISKSLMSYFNRKKKRASTIFRNSLCKDRW